MVGHFNGVGAQVDLLRLEVDGYLWDLHLQVVLLLTRVLWRVG